MQKLENSKIRENSRSKPIAIIAKMTINEIRNYNKQNRKSTGGNGTYSNNTNSYSSHQKK